MPMTRQAFKFTILYSLKNLRRHKLRTTLTLLIISLSLALSVITGRYASSILDLWKRSSIDTGSAHAQVHKSGYLLRQEGLDPELLFDKSSARLETLIKDDPMVVATSKRLKIEGLITADAGSTYFIGTAVQPKNELLVSPKLFYPGYDSGAFITDDGETEACIGRGLAKILKLDIGDEATLVAQTGKGSTNAVDIKVVCIIDVALPTFSKRTVFLNLNLARKLVRLPDHYTELAIRLSDSTQPTKWVKEKQEAFMNDKKLAEFSVVGWRSIDPLISKVENIWLRISQILCGLLVLSSALTVVNVISMTVNERTVEIGTLRALGASPKTLMRVLSVDGLILGCISALIGLALANTVVYIMGRHGIPFESPFGSGIETVHPSISLSWNVYGSIIVVIGCGLCSIPAALKATKVQPVIAFRDQI